MDGRSALEKAVGRKDRSSQNLSYQQQIERFPQLKNAPMAQNMKKVATGADGNGDAATSAPMMVNFKPLGAQILHVRCLACGVWGHQRGDRECAKSGWNPFALPSQASKDPTASSNLNMSSSSIMPVAPAVQELSAIDKSKRRRHNADDSDSDSERRRRHRRHRRHRKRKHRRRRDRDESSRSSSDDSRVSEQSHARTPSSEDSHKLKRREDRDYSDVSDYDDDSRRERDNDRKRRHKSSEKKKKKRKHDSSRRKKKRHRHSSRSYDSE